MMPITTPLHDVGGIVHFDANETDSLPGWTSRPMSRLPQAPENALSMRATQAIINCRLEPMQPSESAEAQARRMRLTEQRALMVAARAVEHVLNKLHGNELLTPTLSACLKIAKAVIDAYRNAEWAEGL
jgi:hypothetical protein